MDTFESDVQFVRHDLIEPSLHAHPNIDLAGKNANVTVCSHTQPGVQTARRRIGRCFRGEQLRNHARIGEAEADQETAAGFEKPSPRCADRGWHSYALAANRTAAAIWAWLPQRHINP